ncbi:MAG: hypothetical protein ACTMHT_08285, partial [Oceanisphaera sp.]
MQKVCGINNARLASGHKKTGLLRPVKNVKKRESSNSVSTLIKSTAGPKGSGFFCFYCTILPHESDHSPGIKKPAHQDR